MKSVVNVIAFFLLSIQVFSQDTIFKKIDIDRGSTFVLKSLNTFYILGNYPNGSKSIEGDLKIASYNYPERISGMGSTPSYREMGKMLTAYIYVPKNDLKTFHPNGTMYQHFNQKSGILVTRDSSNRILETMYLNRKLGVDSLLTYYYDGTIRSREIGNRTEYQWTLKVNFERSNELYVVNNIIPLQKRFYYSTGELESIWTVDNSDRIIRFPNYKKEFFSREGDVRSDLIQTNDYKNMGVLTTFYLNGYRKSQETLYREELHGTYRLWNDTGQLIELGSKNIRVPDSTITTWYDNGIMKSWTNTTGTSFSWHPNGNLKSEHCGRHGLNFQYPFNGESESLRDNHYNTDWNRSGVINVAHLGGRDSLGFRHGKWNGYYEDSCLAYTAEFEHGFQVGDFIQYSNEGFVIRTSEFDHGSANGATVYYDRNNGARTSEGRMENDYKSGKWNQYYQDGRLFQVSEFRKGYEFLIYIRYHNNDSIAIDSEIDSVEEQIVTSSYGPNGIILKRITRDFNGGQRIEELFHSNGNMKSYRGHFPNEEHQVGTYIRKENVFDSLGNVIDVIEFPAPHIPEITRRYRWDGTLEYESIYGFKGEKNTFSAYHSNGQLKEYSVYKGSISRRDQCTKKYFDSDGKLIKREEIVDGEVVKTVPKPKSFFD